MRKKIAVIGAGITGLYSSIILCEKGHDVTVYETNDTAGGILSDIVYEGENYFKTCQLLNANSKWFKRLNEISSVDFNIFEPEYSSFVSDDKNEFSSNNFSIPIFDKFKVPEKINQENIITIKDRINLYDKKISNFLEKFASNLKIDTSIISSNCAINLQINRIASLSQQDYLEKIKNNNKIYDDIYAINSNRLNLKYLSALPKNGFNEFFNDLVEKYKKKIQFNFNTKIIPYWENNKLFLKTKTNEVNADVIIWTGNPTPLINSHSEKKMKSVIIRVKQLNIMLKFSNKKFFYTQVFSVNSPIYRIHLYKINDVSKISVEMIDNNLDDKDIISQLLEILNYFNVKIEINAKSVNFTNLIRHDLTSLNDYDLITSFQKKNKEKSLINSPWQTYGRDNKILSLMNDYKDCNLI